MEKTKPPVALDALPIFKGIKPEMIHALVEGGVAVTTKHRGVLFTAGNPATHFGLVLQGAYKLVRGDASGNESIIYFSCPGDAIAGLVMHKANAAYPVTVVSIGPSMVLKIPRETYIKSWATNPILLQKINSFLYQRMNKLQEEKLKQRLPLSARVASLLVELIEKYSSTAENILPLPITRQEIADSVGSTVESVIRLMSEWASEGFIKTEDRQIEILKLEQIISISKGDTDS